MKNTPKHDHVHPFSAWIAVVNAAVLGLMLPSLMYAQDTGFFNPPPPDGSFQQQPFGSPTQFGSQPMPTQPDPAQCVNSRCEPLKRDCFAKVGDNKDAMAQCEKAVSDCVASCQGQGAPTGSNLQPFVQGDQNFQFVPGQTGPNGQFTPPQGGQFPGQPGQFPGGQPGQFPGGPQGFGGEFDQEKMERMQAEQEERMKKEQAKHLANAKKQMAQFAKQMTTIKKRVAALEKKGVKAPAELTAALAKADELSGRIQAAQSFEDMEGIPEEMQEVGEIIREQMPNLERLANVSQIYRRIDTQLKTFDRQLTQDKALAKRSKVDLNAAVADFEQALAAVKASYGTVKAKISAGEVEEGFDLLESEVFDRMEEVGEYHATIQQLGKMQTTISQISREITRSQQQIDRLKRAKKDVTAAQEVINEGKAKLEELKTVAAAKPFDPEAVFDLLNELEDVRDRFQHELNLLQGVKEVDEVDRGLRFQQFNLPDLSVFGGQTGPQPGSGPQPTERLPL